MNDAPRYLIRYAPGVESQMAEIHDYVAEQGSPLAAIALREKLLNAIASLDRFPDSGRPIGRGLRELTTVRPYLIRYRISGLIVVVTRIRHSARRPD